VTDSVKVHCARCGESAAEFSLVPPAAGSRSQHYGLQRTGFMGQVTKFGELAELRRQVDLAHVADYTALRSIDTDFVAFHCWECKRSYCERCWRIGPPEFDEGFYDCTRGVCPDGHEQIVDD
jgi:hypothetical protein